MPELPEVETIRKELAGIIGHSIIAVTINDARPVQNPLQEFSSGLTGRRILKIGRRGKYLILRLSGGKVLLVHLRMTGALLLNPARLDKFSRVIFELEDHQVLAFRDIRRFGTLQLADDAASVEHKLGIEPLEPRFTAKLLEKLFAGRSAPVKAALLDQSLIAGLGNMYADEALFTARIHPLRKAGALTHHATARLHGAIISVLQGAIACGGASVTNYQRPDGSAGMAHCNFKVAHRLGEKCLVCGMPIKRIVIRQRGTYFCPRCQK